ncbi:transcriptional regulator TyrR [Reinekea thalattae]|uniref:HTH-type transcriptional regulatory protein TyrR n=1 Tax=Reinekea thalattae TaxID=2593301 RepID=A0A5C8Z734_9GAMM|nr:transcriptional regulator TyrR [Reinekea thalattae]TXR53762.1 transcriptional regulator TyrR [Reinekea thalattae]
MKLHIRCEQRLGICAEILEIVVQHQIDLVGIETSKADEIFLQLPDVEFSTIQQLMPEIRLIVGVEDVSLIEYSPMEREQQAYKTILATLPEPVISVDTRGLVIVANEAAQNLLGLSAAQLREQPLKNWLKGFNLNRWLDSDHPESQAVNVDLKGQDYLADLYPIRLADGGEGPLIAGAVMTFKSPERLGRQINAYHQQSNQFDQIVAQSQAMKKLVDQAQRMSDLDAPLLITGETGTGKELLAKACHQNSLRREKPFLVLNCAAIPDDAAESELFGFAGSADKKGIIELAEEGTVFLDEIGDMSPLLQNKFLRLLQDGSYRRVGDEKEYRSNVRIICSTQKNLIELCQAGQFREDLYYRLDVLKLHIPPLRERKADILPIAAKFVNRYAESRQTPIQMSMAFQDALKASAWPGNVRQLENALLRAVLMLEDNVLEPDHLELPQSQDNALMSIDSFDGSLDETMKRFEAQLLKSLFPSYPSSRQLGKKLGVSHTAIANKLREYRIGKHADG